MPSTRKTLLELAEQGRIAPQHLRQALMLTGSLPTKAHWQRFLDQLLLWLGTILVSTGTIFFFAYNWSALGRFAKFGLVELFVIGSLLFVWWIGLEHIVGKAALLASSLLVGTLLALIGQIYQTGADTFELFATWALAILPWVLVGRFAALWMVWLVVVHIATVLYYQTFVGILFIPQKMLWILLLLSTAALIVWEGCSASGVAWLRERWATRLLATASGSFMTALALLCVLDEPGSGILSLVVWIGWLGGVYGVYRHLILDVYVLAGSVLSVVTVVSCFLGQRVLPMSEAWSFLYLGLAVIGLSAVGGWWLKQIAAQENV